MKTHESEEMYLETILLLLRQKPNVRSVDVVDELGYAKSSVSRAVNLLLKKGYILINEGGDITLTETGKKRAESTYEKHRIFTEMFVRMGAGRELAEENACRMEHVISDELFEIIKKNFES
ncbi:MAG: metal-dependent transcriptional regulator [Clostridia bacterium]|nr:metal-dependent transcriptional regulator [Clostridia bacterium]